MKFHCLQENFSEQVKLVKRAVSKKNQLPVLQCFLLEAKNQSVYISGTDLQIGIRSKLGAEVIEEGIVAVPADILSSLLQSLEAGKITCLATEEGFQIVSKKGKSSITTNTAHEFPPFPEPSKTKITLSNKQIEQVLKKVVFAASRDETRPALTALFCNASEKEFVATDGFRLSVLKSQESLGEEDYMIPAKAFAEVLSTVSLEELGEIRFFLSKEMKQLFFSFQQYEVFLRLLELEYPPYKKIIPQEFQFSVNIDVGELQKTLKRASLFVRGASQVVSFSFLEKGKLIVKADSNTGSFIEEIQLSQEKGEGQEIAFNVQYIIDFLQQCAGDTVVFSMNESLQPAQFQEEGVNEHRYIVMPFRLNQVST